MIYKICSKCVIEKDINDFYKDNSHSDKHKTICKECDKKYSMYYRLVPENKIRKKNVDAKYYLRPEVKYHKRKYRIIHNRIPSVVEKNIIYRLNYNSRSSVKTFHHNNPWERRFAAIRRKCQKKNIPFSISKDYLKSLYINSKVCPILKILIIDGFREGGSKENLYSVDRIDNNKGYIEGNLWIISRLANTMKSNANPEELIKFADWVLYSNSNIEYYPYSIVKKKIDNLIYKVKYKSKIDKLNFSLSHNDIKIPMVCPILSIPININNHKRGNYSSPSIDRIDNSKGYVKDNIQVISFKANMMKSSATREQLILFAKWVKNKYQGIKL